MGGGGGEGEAHLAEVERELSRSTVLPSLSFPTLFPPHSTFFPRAAREFGAEPRCAHAAWGSEGDVYPATTSPLSACSLTARSPGPDRWLPVPSSRQHCP